MAEESVEDVAKRLGCSVEYLQEQPPWFQEGRQPTEEEYMLWCRAKKGGCHEYAPAFPLTRYQGMCSFYIKAGRKHCGVPFVSKLTCRTGEVETEKGKHRSWKDFRRNFDEFARHKKVILYNCEDCGEQFPSLRARSGPKVCGRCTQIRRDQGRGVFQRLRRRRDRYG